MPVVDAWMQHPTPRFLAHPMFASLLRWMGVDSPPDDVDPELTLRALDDGGVDIGVLSAWVGPDGALLDNDEVAALCARSPGRFVGLAAVDLRHPVAAVAELRRCVLRLGFRGLRLLPWWWELPPDHRLCYPLYAACVELGVPLCLQVGHTGPLRPSEYGRPIPYLERVALDFPELTIVAGHIGAPWTDELIFLARKFPGVHIDTSAYLPRRYPTALVDYLRGGGRRKVLFGSNWPMLAPQACLAQLDELGLDPEARAAFLGGNAARIFRL